MDIPKYRPFVKRLNMSALGDECEPIIMQIPTSGIKIASSGCNVKITEYNENNPPRANIERIVVTGLGSYEGYGPNVNGDGFHEDHLLSVPKDVYIGKLKYDKPMCQTFVDFSRLYKHHKNRMHDQAYGEIPFVAYNSKMRRVEIIVDLFADEESNVDILENLIRYIYPEVSMGFRCVPGDVCSVHLNYNNPFPTRGHYCDHLKKLMLQMDPVTGKMCYAINHNGYFFDLSIIGRGADRIARGMRRLSAVKQKPATVPAVVPTKTASHVGMKFFEYSSKLAEEDGTVDFIVSMERIEPQKVAEEPIFSIINDNIKNNPDPYFQHYGLKLVYRTDVPMSKEALDYMACNYPLKNAFVTLAGCGIIPSPQEFQRMVLVNAGCEKYADCLEEDNIIFDIDSIDKPDYRYDITKGTFDVKLAENLRDIGILDERSYYAPFLLKRATMIKEALTVSEFFQKYPLIKSPLPRKKLPEDYQQRVISQGVASSPVGQHYVKYPDPVMSDGRYISKRPGGVSVKHQANPIIPLAILGALFAGGKWLASFTNQGPVSKGMSNPLFAAGAFGATAVLTWAAGRIGVSDPQKTASVNKNLAQIGSDYALHFLAGIAISYGLAGRAELKRERGIQPNILEEATEKRPALGAIMSGLGVGVGMRALARKFASDELEMLENGIIINDMVIGEYDHKYVDKMARISLNHSALLLK